MPWRRVGGQREDDDERALDPALPDRLQVPRIAHQSPHAASHDGVPPRLAPSTDAQSEAARTQDEFERLRADARRYEAAQLRDELALERDRAAERRDDSARDEDAGFLATDPGNQALRAIVAANTERRDQVIEDRRRAASDRQRAAEDRLAAAAAQRQARVELQRAQLDGQVGVYAREFGRATLRSEIDRCRRHDDPFVLVLIRIAPQPARGDWGDGTSNPSAASVVAALRDKLRSYDPVVRIGEAEFLCALPGSATHDAHQRVADIRTAIEHRSPASSVRFGIATLEPVDTLDTLITRASAALEAT